MNPSLARFRRRRQEKGGEGGFTLIELLIVIVILGILAAIVVFAVQNLSGTSAQSACRSDYKTVESATEAFDALNGAYPGGTYNGGDTVTAASAPSSAPYENNPGILTLLGTSTIAPPSGPSQNSGPWLKDYPYNAGHYQIEVSHDGKGTISVYNTNASPAQIGPGAGGTGTPTNSVADCSGVS